MQGREREIATLSVRSLGLNRAYSQCEKSKYCSVWIRRTSEGHMISGALKCGLSNKVVDLFPCVQRCIWCRTVHTLTVCSPYTLVGRTKELWRQQWRRESRYFYEVKPTLKKWAKMFKMSRREEVVINRLRLVHTLITHGYLFDYGDGFIRQLLCRWCEAELLCIRHVLLDCPVLQNVRKDILKTALLDRNITMETLIGESGAIRSVLIYLREIEIFDEIWIHKQSLTSSWGGHYYRHSSWIGRNTNYHNNTLDAPVLALSVSPARELHHCRSTVCFCLWLQSVYTLKWLDKGLTQ